MNRASAPRVGKYRSRLAVVAAAIALAGCREGPPRRDETPPPPPPKTAAPSASASAPAAPSVTASASAAPAPEAETLAGTWEGRYDAKKGSVVMPPHVKDKSFAKDDGKTAVGAGTITITVGPDGELSGKGKGALGPITLSGKAEGTMIRASILPEDPAAPRAMTGVLVGMQKNGAIEGEIHVAGPDATMVRDAAITLKRK